MILPAAFLNRPIAHRTLHDAAQGRPENSIAGARAAVMTNYAIEIDLQLSKDGVPMVFHDYALDLLTHGTGAIAQHSAAQLGEIGLKGGDEPIPTLAAFLSAVEGDVPLLIEIKDQDGALGMNVGALERATCDILRDYKGCVALMSFNPHAIAKCGQFAPDIPRGLVTDPFSKNDWPMLPTARRSELATIPDYDRVGACFISHNVVHLTDPTVQNIKDKNGVVLCWTVRSAAQEKTARIIAQNITFEGYLA